GAAQGRADERAGRERARGRLRDLPRARLRPCHWTAPRSPRLPLLRSPTATGCCRGGSSPGSIRAAPPRPRPGRGCAACCKPASAPSDRKSTRLNSSHRTISYAVFCLKKKKKKNKTKKLEIKKQIT